MGDNGVGDRLRRYRRDLGMSQADLARKAKVSAAYISELEGGLGKRPSGEILLRLADALDVTIAELLGRDIRPSGGDSPVPDPSLLEFARERELPQSDVKMLASIRFRGDPPRTKRRWAMIYDTIVASRTLDET
ncbi:MAG: helix-turn-helix domain-containing protein [Egibacteraceae bacterium]